MSNEISIILSLTTAQASEKLRLFLSSATSGLKNLAIEAAAAYASIEGLRKLDDAISEAIKLEEAIGRLSQKTGLSIPLIAAFRSEAIALGVPFEQMNTSLGKFAGNVYQAATLGGPLADTFKRMGVNLLDVNGRIRDTDSLLSESAQWFKVHAASAEKARFAQELFGRSGRELIPVLNEGAEGIQKMRDAGGPITDESYAMANEFSIKVREIKEQIEFLFIAVANKLLPNMIQFADVLKSLVADSKNADSSISAFADTLKGLASVTVVVVYGFTAMGKIIAAVASGIVDSVEFMFKEVKIVLDAMVEDFKSAGTVIQDVFSGNFSKVADDAKTFAQTVSDNYFKPFDAAGNFFKLQTANAKSFLLETGLDVMKLGDLLDSLWKKQPQTPVVKSGGAAQSDGAFGPTVQDMKRFSELASIQQEIYKQQVQQIEKNPYLSQVEQAELLIPLLEHQRNIISENLATANAENNAASTQDQKIAAMKQINKLQSELIQLDEKETKANSLKSFGAQFAQTMTKLKNEWGTWATQAASAFSTVFNSAIGSISSGITGLIMGTKTWGQALMQIGNTILTTIVEAIVQMGVRWILTQLAMAAFGRATAVAATASLIPIAAAQAAIWSAPATLATISSYGDAAVMAPPEIATAQALVLAASAREFGGPVAAGMPYVVGEKRPELFVPSQSGYIVPSVPQGASADSGSGQVVNEIHVLSFTDEAALNKHLRDNPQAHHILVDKFKRNAHVILPRS